MADNKGNLSCAWDKYLIKATQDYADFMQQETPMEAKEFAAHHNAGKAALAHILMLQKMIGSQINETKEQDLFDLLEQAREATNEDTATDSFD